MRYGLFGDIHGNLEALDAVLKALDKERCDRLVCLGDIIGYGANPKECLDKVRNRGIATIAGNHDLAASGKFDIDAFNAAARDAILFSISKLTASDQEFLSALPLTKDDESFLVVHASPLKPENFDYIFSVQQAEDAFEAMTAHSLGFIGHSHVPVIFFKDPDATDFTYASEFYLRRKRKIIFNCGSVGQPRDGDPAACYSVFDSNIAKSASNASPTTLTPLLRRYSKPACPPFLRNDSIKGFESGPRVRNLRKTSRCLRFLHSLNYLIQHAPTRSMSL